MNLYKLLTIYFLFFFLSCNSLKKNIEKIPNAQEIFQIDIIGISSKGSKKGEESTTKTIFFGKIKMEIITGNLIG